MFHFHLHLIPRYGENDGFGAVWKSHQNEYTMENLQNIASTIANSVK
ncbi:cell cycle regulation histidine triad (HIT) protein [Streptococcus pneumoniae]|nr:cell cycle regulation histidine triad (HIT) protein [Streptococcus pneumoniae]